MKYIQIFNCLFKYFANKKGFMKKIFSDQFSDDLCISLYRNEKKCTSN